MPLQGVSQQKKITKAISINEKLTSIYTGPPQASVNNGY